METNLKTPELEGLARAIEHGIREKGRYYVTHQAELKILHALTDPQLDRFAHEHGWEIVRHLGGTQIEFFPDAAFGGSPV